MSWVFSSEQSYIDPSPRWILNNVRIRGGRLILDIVQVKLSVVTVRASKKWQQKPPFRCRCRAAHSDKQYHMTALSRVTTCCLLLFPSSARSPSLGRSGPLTLTLGHNVSSMHNLLRGFTNKPNTPPLDLGPQISQTDTRVPSIGRVLSQLFF
jgi:hypothetical protein